MKLMEMAALTACFEVKTLDCTVQISLNNIKACRTKRQNEEGEVK